MQFAQTTDLIFAYLSIYLIPQHLRLVQCRGIGGQKQYLLFAVSSMFMCYIYTYRNIHMNIFIILRNDHRIELPKYRLFCHPGDICQHLETFLSQLGMRGRYQYLSGRGHAAAAKSLQSCPTQCDPIDSSPPGSPVPGILQARTLEWVAISFPNM